MTPSAPGALSGQAFRRSLSDRIKSQARTGPRNAPQLHREFLMQRFLTRVFADADGPWILKGGTGLLVRLPGARHSKDIDLLHPDATLDRAVTELGELASRPGSDPYSFVLGQPEALAGGVAGAQIPVDAYLDATKVDSFTIDLSTDLHTIGSLERTRPTPVIDMPGLPALPEFALYPLPDQVADKVCAMYERHGDRQSPSSRFRDLVDLVLITSSFSLDASSTVAALSAEARRRHLTLPSAMTVPGPDWPRGYRVIANASILDPGLRDLVGALAKAGSCLDPLLGDEISTGVWEHGRGIWEPVPRRKSDPEPRSR